MTQGKAVTHMLPFMLLNRQEQTDATIAGLTTIRDLLNIGLPLSTEAALERIDLFLDFLDLRTLLGDQQLRETHFLADQLRAQVLPTHTLGPDINFFRHTLRDHLAKRNPFAYAFHAYLLDVLTLAHWQTELPTHYLHGLHYSVLRGRDENSEYLYEAINVITDLAQYHHDLTR